MPAHDPGGLMATSIGRRPGPTTRLRVVEWNGDQHSLHEDRLTTEEPLAAGLLLSEGVVDTIDDVRTVAYCTDETLTTEQEFNVVTVSLARPPRATWDDQQMASTSAWGVCGKDSLDAVAQMCTSDQRATATEPPSPDLLRSLPDRLREQQRVFDSTGGLHAAGLFSTDGAVHVVREHVGRRNAVDKAIGHCLLNRIDAGDALMCTSGRLGFEIVQKAASPRGRTLVDKCDQDTSAPIQGERRVE